MVVNYLNIFTGIGLIAIYYIDFKLYGVFSDIRIRKKQALDKKLKDKLNSEGYKNFDYIKPYIGGYLKIPYLYPNVWNKKRKDLEQMLKKAKTPENIEKFTDETLKLIDYSKLGLFGNKIIEVIYHVVDHTPGILVFSNFIQKYFIA